jgi:Carboxypeptidase regulatory-like domain
MRLLVWLATALVAGVAANAGVIQGVVMEQASGVLLARSTLRLDPVPKAGGGALRSLQARAGRKGEFLLLGIPEGLYILTATRAEYAPTAYGQRRLGGQGTPIQVTADSSLFAELRMARLGAISGRVLDENGAGISGVTVIAYRARLPLRQAGHAESDDRGVYRIHGLDPGKYWIRSAAYTLDDGTGLLPTFGPQSREARNARIQEVRLDYETQSADVEPETGALFSLTGKATCAPEPLAKPDGTPPPALMVTLSSETGRKSMQTVCGGGYRFEGLAPSRYQVFGELADGSESGFVELSLDRNSDLGSVALIPPPQVEFLVSRASQGEARNNMLTLTGRRDDLSEVDQARAIKTPRTTLAAGYWDLQGSAGSGQYVESIGPPTPLASRIGAEQAPDDSFRVLIANRPGMSVRVVIAEPVGAIAGGVAQGGNPVPGVPVFLWPAADEVRRQLGGTRQILSNTDGKFRFEGLPPGDYRLLASFDIQEADAEIVELANAVKIHAAASESAAVELPLWMAP